MRQSVGPAGRGGARRAGRRCVAQPALLLQSARLPRHPVRPEGLRQVEAARLGRPVARRQHDVAPGGRHGGLARASRRQAMGGVRRLVGFDAGARLCAQASRPGGRPDPARHFPRPPAGARLVLPGGRQPHLSGPVGTLRGADPAGGTRQPARGLYQAIEFRRSGVDAALRPGVERLGG